MHLCKFVILFFTCSSCKQDHCSIVAVIQQCATDILYLWSDSDGLILEYRTQLYQDNFYHLLQDRAKWKPQQLIPESAVGTVETICSSISAVTSCCICKFEILLRISEVCIIFKNYGTYSQSCSHLTYNGGSLSYKVRSCHFFSITSAEPHHLWSAAPSPI